MPLFRFHRGLVAAFVLCTALCSGADVPTATRTVQRDLAYKEGAGNLSDYERERCRLDLYLPTEARDFPTLVWFHGGGLTGGQKASADTRRLAERLAQRGIAVASVNYRLSPKVGFPAYIEDAAAAFAWVRKTIVTHGGSTSKVYIGGHSAGAYLALMTTLDPQYLGKQGLGDGDVAGIVSLSPQTMTHETVRVERGLPKARIIADQAAPVFHARKDAPPLLALWAEHDIPSRGEESAFFVELLKATGHGRIRHRVLMNRDHASTVGKIDEPDDQLFAEIVGFIGGRKG